MILSKSTRFIALAAAAAVSFSALAIDLDPAAGGNRLPPIGHASAAAYGGATVASAGETAAPYAGGQWAWERLDRNADGFISRSEASADSAIAAAFAGLDGDRDGKLSAMDFGASGTFAP